MSKTDKPYGAIAGLYEYLMDVDYDGWADYILSAVKQYTDGKTGLDLGCGSGAFTRRFKRAGMDVVGVDLSDEMLAEAVRITREEGLSITYILKDIKKFKHTKRVDFITAVTDCMNYLSPDELQKFFSRAKDMLKTGGVFYFDVSSEYKIRSVLANNMFGEDGEDFSYLWFNTQFEGGVEMDITMYAKTPSGLYERRDEHHVQYAHSKEFILSALEKAGFVVERVEGHLGEKLNINSERINFLAINKK